MPLSQKLKVKKVEKNREKMRFFMFPRGILNKLHYFKPSHTILPRYQSNSSIPSSKINFKGLFREYGSIAFNVYLAISFSFFFCTFTTITLLGVDAKTIQNALHSIKTSLGIQTSPSPSESEGDSKSSLFQLPEWLENPTLIHLGTNILLSLGIAKLFLPIKLGLTMYLTPKVAR